MYGEQTLVIDDWYDRDQLEFVRWTQGDGTGHYGYVWREYFDRVPDLTRGYRYLGPDIHRIEPVFTSESARNARYVDPAVQSG